MNHYRRPDSKPINLTSHGGSGGFVTGSMHILESAEGKFGVDAGLFQGKKEERTEKGIRMNNTPLGEIIRGMTDIAITHAHVDHTGRLPLIAKAGFTPNILATETTADLMEIMLENSGEIQEREKPGNQLYDLDDVDNTLRLIKDVPEYEEIRVGPKKHSHVTMEFIPNGHIIGSNSVVVRYPQNGNAAETILFTGDIGKPEQSLCGGVLDHCENYPQDPITTAVVESTAVEQTPISFDEKRENFLNAIQQTWANGGNPALPLLSLHRIQEVIELLGNSQLEGLLDECDFVFDAPLGGKVLSRIYDMRPGTLTSRYGNDLNYYANEKESIGRFNQVLQNATFVTTHEQSQATSSDYAATNKKAIILASGGMGEHGRSLNYLRGEFGRNPKNSFIFTCHQVAGTAGENLVKVGAVNTYNGKERGKGASIMQIEGFSGHANGPDEIIGFLNRFNLQDLQTVILTHGTDKARQMLAKELKRRRITAEILMPKIGETISLNR